MPEASEEEGENGSRVRPQQQGSEARNVIRDPGARAGGLHHRLADIERVLHETQPPSIQHEASRPDPTSHRGSGASNSRGWAPRELSPGSSERAWDVSPTSEGSADARASLGTLSPSSMAAGIAPASHPAKTSPVPKLDLSSLLFTAGKQTRRRWRDVHIFKQA